LKYARLMLSLISALAIICSCATAMVHIDFVRFEYDVVKLSPDRYGMSDQQRREWAEMAARFLRQGDNMSGLAALTYSDGTTAFSLREREHLQDTFMLSKFVRIIAFSCGLIVFASVFFGIAARSFGFLSRALSAGALIAGGMALCLALIVPFGFKLIFVAFHSIFFKGASWVFYDTDTLLRLFPLRFWRDAFLAYFSLVLSSGVVIFLAGWLSGGKYRSDHSP